MNKKYLFTLIVIMLFSAVTFAQVKKLTSYVNPMIGTSGHGHTYPGAVMPFGMVQLSPDTGIDGWDLCSGYHFLDNSIMGFSHTHLSGTGCADLADIMFMPTVGEVTLTAGKKDVKGDGYRSSFKHENEKAAPGYYSVILDDYNIKAELTATERVGFHKYTFPKSSMSNIIIDLQHGLASAGDCTIRIVNKNTIEGKRTAHGWANEHTVYFIAKFSKPFSAWGTSTDDKLNNGSREASGQNVKAYVKYTTKEKEAIIVKVAISAVSLEGARKNMENEAGDFDFDKVRENADKVWEKELNKIVVETPDENLKKVFYTALYHSMITPNLFNDVDGKYMGMDRKVHEAKGENVYTVFSLWDTFRALHPLHTIINQKRTQDFVNTMLHIYKDGGLLPVWELAANETFCMIAYHSIPVIFDAYMKGINNFDTKLALKAMETSAEKDQFGLKYYKDRGFIPDEKENESVSKTLEYCYDDWCIAQFAKQIGAKDDYEKYNIRSLYYKNVFDKSTGFFRGKSTSGAWYTPFNPFEVNQIYTEANAWQYSFFAPHDVKGLIDLQGGNEKFALKLDSLFSAVEKLEGREQPDISGMIGQYAHGNEPSHHMAYLYNYAGYPSKTQSIVREIMTRFYTPEVDGLCGNDDCGQMSAWYVFSAMGFYPVCPGQNTYVIGSPMFDKVTINLENGKKFVVTAKNNSIKNKYIKSALINGDKLNYSYFTHDQIMNGSTAVFEMTDKPVDLWNDNNPALFSMLPDKQAVAIPFITASSEVFYDDMTVTLTCPTDGAKIFYTLDGSKPGIKSIPYDKPFTITNSITVKAAAYGPQGDKSQITSSSFIKSKYPAAVYKYPFNARYNGGGFMALTDGRLGTVNFQSGEWQGFEGVDLDVTIDLTKDTKINKISAGFLHNNGVWIFLPKKVEFYISSDGKEFKKVGSMDNEVPPESPDIIVKRFSTSMQNENARYIRVVANSIGICPAWHKGAGGKAWVFVDEITVE